MSDLAEGLETYLNDHLSGSISARALVERTRETAGGGDLGAFLGELLRDIDEDQAELASIMRTLEVPEHRVKQAAGSLLEKASRFEFERSNGDAGRFNRVLALEAMLMGIEGKAALWRTLKLVATSEPRLGSKDFDRLLRRARQQQKGVERHHKELVLEGTQ